ncbi:hypothetical protein DD630_24995 [Streptomyces sp. BSE7F]|nr:hypothetical protein DD630_24995 [Streptomyces sp. BSE7F]
MVLAGCAGAWFLFDSGDERVGCNSLLENERIHSALGDAYDSDMSCTRLGAEIKKATTGIQPGQHSLRQAQAMKDVILAVHDELGTADGRVDRQLSLPLARSLADYAADTETILGIGNADYVRRAVPDEPAWEDEHGVHMSVGNVWLLPVVRAVSEDPAAYVTLSKAATRQAAAGLTAVKPGTTGPGLALPSTRNARLLGTWSGVAADVRRDVGKEAAAKWDRAVFEGLTKNTVEPPSYAQDPVNHLVTSWQRELLTRGPTTTPRPSRSKAPSWSTPGRRPCPWTAPSASPCVRTLSRRPSTPRTAHWAGWTEPTAEARAGASTRPETDDI